MIDFHNYQTGALLLSVPNESYSSSHMLLQLSIPEQWSGKA